jgi:hypothetical protein
VEAASGLASEVRSVSCRPGAEGAPLVVVLVLEWAVVLFVDVAWPEEGTTRRDCACQCWSIGSDDVDGP